LQYFATSNAQNSFVKKKYVNWTNRSKSIVQNILKSVTYVRVHVCVHTREKQRSVTSVCLIRARLKKVCIYAFNVKINK